MAQAAIGGDGLELTRRETESAPADFLAELDRFGARRLAHEPVSRIMGLREFWGLTFEIGPAVLDPRPETELLVGRAIALLQVHPAPFFVDLGTGSGALAVAIAHAVPQARGLATDLSAAALATARRNAERHGVADRLDFAHGDWWGAVPAATVFDLVVANPPYIETAAIAGLMADVRCFDPHAALDGGADGLDAYRTITLGINGRLGVGGGVLLEIGATQGAGVARILASAGLGPVTIVRDLAGQDRVISAEKTEGRREHRR